MQPTWWWVMGGVVPTLNAFDNGDSRVTVIIFDSGWHGDGIRMSEDTVPTLRASSGTNTPMVTYPIQDGREMDKSQNGLGVGKENDPAYPMHGGIIGRQDHNGPGGSGFGNENDPCYTLTSHMMTHGVVLPATVRRLTPTECERLQGFPDGWTSQRIDEKKGLIEQADSSRYKQMGNAVAVPCVEWIVNRLVAYEQVR